MKNDMQEEQVWKDPNPCTFCKRVASSRKKCSACRVAFYCVRGLFKFHSPVCLKINKDSKCQKNDWPTHKSYCQMNRLADENIKKGLMGFDMPDGIDPSALNKSLKRFVDKNAQWILMVAGQALDLESHPRSHETEGVLITLEPHYVGEVHPYLLTLEDAKSMPIDMLQIMAGPIAGSFDRSRPCIWTMLSCLRLNFVVPFNVKGDISDMSLPFNTRWKELSNALLMMPESIAMKAETGNTVKGACQAWTKKEHIFFEYSAYNALGVTQDKSRALNHIMTMEIVATRKNGRYQFTPLEGKVMSLDEWKSIAKATCDDKWINDRLAEIERTRKSAQKSHRDQIMLLSCFVHCAYGWIPISVVIEKDMAAKLPVEDNWQRRKYTYLGDTF